MGYVYLGQSRIASIFKELPVETLIDKLCNKSAIETLDIPDGVSAIGDYLFYNCPNLTKVIIPASVDDIGENAFYNSNKIEVIEFNGPPPSTVGDNAFPNTVGIYTKDYKAEWEAVIVGGNWNGLTMEEYIDPSYTVVKYLDGSTSSFLIEGEIAGTSSSPFYTTQIDNIRNATDIKLSKSITSIGANTFVNSLNLTSITIPSSVTLIGDSAFYGCRKLTSLTIPDGVTDISRGTFMYGWSLTSVTIPEGVKSIGDNAFNECRRLSSVMIPSSVTSIGSYAFKRCTNLTAETLSEHINEIGKYAFQECNNLTLSIDKYITDITCMTNYPWGLNESQIVALKSGITIPPLPEGPGPLAPPN